MTPRRDRGLALFCLGLLVGWYAVEKGWHRHLLYLLAMLLLAILMRVL